MGNPHIAEVPGLMADASDGLLPRWVALNEAKGRRLLPHLLAYPAVGKGGADEVDLRQGEPQVNGKACLVLTMAWDSTHTCSFCISNLDYCLLLRRKITCRDMDDLLDQMEYCMGYTTQPVLGMAVSLEWEYNWEKNGSQPVHNLSARQLEQLLEQRFSIPVQVMEHNLICLKAYQFFFQSASFINPV